MDTEQLNVFAKMVKDSSYVVCLTGAGVSTESGIPDFRSDKGIYSIDQKDVVNIPPETILSHSFFVKHPEQFYDFYRKKMIFDTAQPNNAHLFMARLEESGKLKAVITQNIDGLHQKAGSKNVLELHGSIHRNFCMKCAKYFGLEYVVNHPDTVPSCDKCGGTVKPDVVLYEESLDMRTLTESVDHVRNADMMIVGGTSLMVNPAASLVTYYRGKRLVLINKSTTPYDSSADMIIKESIGEFLGCASELLGLG